MATWNIRPRDENGWRIPTEGTKSRMVYDLTIAGKSVLEIASETGMVFTSVNALLVQLKPPKPREPKSPSRPATAYTTTPLVYIEDAADLDDAGLEKIVESLNSVAAKGNLPSSLEKMRQYLLHERLIRDMRKFIQRFEPDGRKMIWDSFVGGLERGKVEIESKIGRSFTVPPRYIDDVCR